MKTSNEILTTWHHGLDFRTRIVLCGQRVDCNGPLYETTHCESYGHMTDDVT